VELSLDVRHTETGDKTRVAASIAMLDSATAIAARRKVSVEVLPVAQNATVACSARLTSLLGQAVGGDAVQLTSGAGHDAVAMSALTEVGMLFVRCKGGISHNPAESVTADDVAVAIDVLSRFLDLLAKE
jgi:acetylornithine deacetylase/succinyl-diaminopimelate desuccinylase-like protein